MPNKDPRTSSTQTQRQSRHSADSVPTNTASSVQSEVVAVTQQLAADVSADAYAIGQQTAEYVNQQAFSAFLQGYNEGAAKATSPFSQLRQQLSDSKPKPISLLSLPGSTSTALPANCPASE